MSTFTPDYAEPIATIDPLYPESEYNWIYDEVYINLMMPFYKDGGEPPEFVVRVAKFWAGWIANYRQLEM